LTCREYKNIIQAFDYSPWLTCLHNGDIINGVIFFCLPASSKPYYEMHLLRSGTPFMINYYEQPSTCYKDND